MLTQNELVEIRSILSASSRRLYFFDNDPDGLCSFLLLNKKWPHHDFSCLLTAAHNEAPYLNKIQEVEYDLSVILDRPIVTQNVINQLERVLWVDHHPIQHPRNAKYFNPRAHGKNVPTSFLAYKISDDNSQNNQLLATLGSISDYFFPPFISKIRKNYPKLLPKLHRDLDEVHFTTQLGYLIRVLGFLLIGKVPKVRTNIERLTNLEDIIDLPQDSVLRRHYEKKEQQYKKLLSDAKDNAHFLSPNLVLYTYDFDESYTSYLSNHLRYLFNKNVVVAKESKKHDTITLSIRSTQKDLHPILNVASHDLDGAFGGHENACGGHIKQSDFEKFLNRMRELI